MSDRDLCKDPLNVGKSWPSGQLNAFVGPALNPIQEQTSEELVKIVSDEANQIIIVGGQKDNYYPNLATKLMKYRLECLAKIVYNKLNENNSSTQKYLLKIDLCYIKPNGSSPPTKESSETEKLHYEARIADLKIDPIPPASNVQKELLQKLACFCQEAGFEFVKFEKSDDKLYIHAAVPRDNFLFGLKLPVSQDEASKLLSSGWLPFIDNYFKKQDPGSLTIMIDGPDVALKPIQFYNYGKSELPLGEILLSAASLRGLYPKAYFLNTNMRLQSRPIIRLIPSPIADLSTLLKPVWIDSLEISLRRYSDDRIEFSGKSHQLNAIIKELTEEGGRYHGIEVRLHDPLKSQIVNAVQPADACLTNILDAIALEVHGSWHWIGENRIDFISRPYSEYVGSISIS